MVEQTDEQFRAWMREHFDHAADHFALTVTGEPVYGWYLRSISARVHRDGQPVWLRVGSEQERWLKDPLMADFWTGNVDANAITGAAKPTVVDTIEWSEPDYARRVRADVMTLLPGKPCSSTDVLRDPPDLAPGWWTTLRETLDMIRTVPTSRFRHERSERAVDEAFGVRAPIEQWETVHGDLHWNNVLGPEFGLLDWEMWGRGPAGTDAASLYLFSLLVPDVARRVYDEFHDVLDSTAGRVAQLHLGARLLRRAPDEFPDLSAPLRAHLNRVIRGS